MPPLPRRPALSLLAALPLAGCASIIRGPSQRVEVTSEPSAAKLTVTDEEGVEVYGGATPATLTLGKRKGYFAGKDYTLTVRKEGFKPFTLKLTRTVSAW